MHGNAGWAGASAGFRGWSGLCGGAIYDDGAGLSASFSAGLATCLFETFVTCLLGFKCN